MSRHTIPALDPARHRVVVGWDRQTESFFFQVYDEPKMRVNEALEAELAMIPREPKANLTRRRKVIDQMADDELIAFGGSTPGDIGLLSDLVDRVAPFAQISIPVRAELLRERAGERDCNREVDHTTAA